MKKKIVSVMMAPACSHLLQRDAARQMRVKHLPNQVRKQQV